MKKEFLFNCNKTIVFLLTLLGFATSCGDNFGGTEYGTPHADFIVKGTVLSASTNLPIEHIRLIMRDSITQYPDTAFTDLNGKYLFNRMGFPADHTFMINLVDIDGTAKGEFQSLDTTIVFKNPVFTGGDGHWNSGKTEKELNLKIKPKL